VGNEFTVAIIAGLVGGVISPIIYSEYQAWRRERSWARPRKKRLKALLSDKKLAASGFRSLDRLCLETGMEKEDCRSLLIEIDARGGQMKVKSETVEGWTLVKDKT
jgi:hypothetical protein